MTANIQKVDPDFLAFLSYDFENQKKSQERLCLRTYPYRELVIIKCDKNYYKDLKVIKTLPSDSLSRVVKHITFFQELWHEENVDMQNNLEKQCTRLKVKVTEHNDRILKDKIEYENPYTWNLTIRVTLSIPKDLDSNTQVEDAFVLEFFKFDRLTTCGEVLKKIDTIYRNEISFTMECPYPERDCTKGHHKKTAKIQDVFDKIASGELESLKKNVDQPYLKDSDKGEDRIIELKGEGFKRSYVKDMLYLIHCSEA